MSPDNLLSEFIAYISDFSNIGVTESASGIANDANDPIHNYDVFHWKGDITHDLSDSIHKFLQGYGFHECQDATCSKYGILNQGEYAIHDGWYGEVFVHAGIHDMLK